MAYAFDDSGSLQNTGSASFFGSSVSPMRVLLSGRPTSNRLGTCASAFMTPANPAAAAAMRGLDAPLTPCPTTLTPP